MFASAETHPVRKQEQAMIVDQSNQLAIGLDQQTAGMELTSACDSLEVIMISDENRNFIM